MRNLINRIVNSQRTNYVIMAQIEPVVNKQATWEGHEHSFRVRLATEEDMDVFLELEEDAYNGFHAWRRKDFVADWRNNPYLVYLLVEEVQNKYPVAMISGRFLARGSHISHLIVRQNFQSQKIGKRLLALWIQLVQQCKIPEITLEVRKSNEIAKQLYFKEGFKKVREMRNYYSDNQEAALYLRKKIDYSGTK